MRRLHRAVVAATVSALAAACGGEASDPDDGGSASCEGDGPVRWKRLEPPEALAQPRSGAVAVWTGTEALVWGGFRPFRDDGLRYDPVRDAYSPMSRENAPLRRSPEYVAWTGREMIVWGGPGGGTGPSDFLTDGALYDPERDEWRPMSSDGGPGDRGFAVSVWTGRELLVWGGVTGRGVRLQSGVRYDPETDVWTPMSTDGAPDARIDAAAAWTGREMIVWGGNVRIGDRRVDVATGGRYDPATDTWKPTSMEGAPTARSSATMVVASGEAVVWGGYAPEPGPGGRYSPETDSWRPVAEAGAPSDRLGYVVASTSRRMIVHGGEVLVGASYRLVRDGGIYDPATDAWTPLPEQCAPPARTRVAATWTDAGLFVWGGSGPRDGSIGSDGALLVMPP